MGFTRRVGICKWKKPTAEMQTQGRRLEKGKAPTDWDYYCRKVVRFRTVVSELYFESSKSYSKSDLPA